MPYPGANTDILRYDIAYLLVTGGQSSIESDFYCSIPIYIVKIQTSQINVTHVWMKLAPASTAMEVRLLPLDRRR